MEKNRRYQFTICTGGPYENPGHWGDECDSYEIGVSRHPFYGTLEQAKEKGERLVENREKRDVRCQFDLIWVQYWILDENGNVCE